MSLYSSVNRLYMACFVCVLLGQLSTLGGFWGSFFIVMALWAVEEPVYKWVTDPERLEGDGELAEASTPEPKKEEKENHD
jgi:hypothetical protein